MKKLSLKIRLPKKTLPILIAAALVSFLMIYKLGSLVGGLSHQEAATANSSLGWHAIFDNPFYLPLKLVQALIFPNHGQTLTRLPGTLLGITAIAAFYLLIRVWHGRRTAVLTTLLFATGAWTLHASRLATPDILYLWALPVLLLTNLGIHKKPDNVLVVYGSMLLWGSMLYIPGMIWLLIFNTYLLFGDLAEVWQQFSKLWQRILYLLSGLIWLPLLIIGLTRPGSLKLWIGLPRQLASGLQLLKNLGEVFINLFVHGPQNSQTWLGKAPVFDVFTLIMCILGVYFYTRHFSAFRPRMLAGFGLLSVILVALGLVSLSLLVPLFYIIAAAGIAYLLHEWLQVFPVNPLARGVGLGLIFLAVGLASVYNLRAYFIAWPHNPSTTPAFHYHR